NEDAKDLTQAFFTRTLEKNSFERYDPAQARFRTYLRTCVDGFVANERKSAGRIKRGGAVQLHCSTALDPPSGFAFVGDEAVHTGAQVGAESCLRGIIALEGILLQRPGEEGLRQIFGVFIEIGRASCREML